MMTAIEAKQESYRKTNGYYSIVESKIVTATTRGETSCSIDMDEISNGTPGMLSEIAYLLIELGYQALISENTLNVYWTVQKPMFYNIFDDLEEDEYW
jgi:hypothetical protein